MSVGEFEHFKRENERLLEYLNQMKPLFSSSDNPTDSSNGGGPVLELFLEGYDDYEIELPK